MRRWAELFPSGYPQSAGGLAMAEDELVRLADLHAAYASQPNVTPIWQGYIDQKAQGLAKQRATVERLRTVVRESMQAKADAAAARV